METRARATRVGALAILLWSSLAALASLASGVPALQLLALSFGIAGLAGLAWLARPGGEGWRVMRQPPAAFALSTLALAGYHALYFIALQQAPAVEASLVNYLWPLLIVVFAACLPGARPRPAQFLGTALGLLGAALVVTKAHGLSLDPAHVPGYLAALAAAVVWAAYSVLNRRHAGVPSAAIVSAILATALLGGVAHLAFETTVAPTSGQWLAIVAMGLGPAGAAFWLWDHGCKRGDLALLGTLSYAAPLLSTTLLLLLGLAQPHWTQAVAVGLLLLGAWISLRATPAPDAG